MHRRWRRWRSRRVCPSGSSLYRRPRRARAVPALHLLSYVSPNADELVAMAAAVRAAQGLPPLSPAHAGSNAAGHTAAGGVGSSGALGGRLPAQVGREANSRAAGSGRADAWEQEPASSSASTSGRQAGDAAEAQERVQALLPQLCAVLRGGARNVMLTLGRLGAAWCRLRFAHLLLYTTFCRGMQMCLPHLDTLLDAARCSCGTNGSKPTGMQAGMRFKYAHPYT